MAKNVSRGRENVIIGRLRGGAGWDVRMVCSSSLKLAVLASQAVSSAEPGRMRELRSATMWSQCGYAVINVLV